MRYCCDNPLCGATFTKALLKPAATNIQIMGVSLIGANKDGKPICVSGQFKEGDQTLHCPECGQLHLFGFNSVEESEKEVA